MSGAWGLTVVVCFTTSYVGMLKPLLDYRQSGGYLGCFGRLLNLPPQPPREEIQKATEARLTHSFSKAWQLGTKLQCRLIFLLIKKSGKSRFSLNSS